MSCIAYRPLHNVSDPSSAQGGAAAAAEDVPMFPGPSMGGLFPSTSSDTRVIRLLDFNIEYRERNINLKVPDNENVGK